MKEKVSIFVPGRLCLFGEHSDWAGVHRTINPSILPGCAIVTGVEQGIYATAEKNDKFIVMSDLPEYEGRAFESKMDMMVLRQVAREGGFFSYVAGVASYMCEWYHVGGIKLVINKMTLPMKSGLSSSAAICVLVARAFNELYDLHLNHLGLMNIAYWGEQRTPSQCGRLDQACAFGVRPVSMIFDGNEIEVEEISVGGPLYYVFADLAAGKNTVKILDDLNSAYPSPKNEKERAVHEALGVDNKKITDLAKKYISEGDSKKLGALMTSAQELFDEKVAPMCPEELTSPALHSVLNDENVKKLVYGSKGVGSQGDGTVQFLAKSVKDQKNLMEYLETERKMPAYALTLRPDSKGADSDIFKGELYIFGAQLVAVGAIRAIRKSYRDCRIKGCVVSTLDGNPTDIEGLEVEELKAFEKRFSDEEKHNIKILIATPIYVHDEICETLKLFGFHNTVCLDSNMEETLMHRYFKSENHFISIKDIESGDSKPAKVHIFSICHNADKRLRIHYKNDPWVTNIQVGAANTDIRLCETTDMPGDNISAKNSVYGELTGLYWMWKNVVTEDVLDEYFGIYQYRRVLNVDEDDLRRITHSNIDVILPYPMIHLPDIREHHRRYTNESEWNLLMKSVKELSPKYMSVYDKIFEGEYFYNYNMFISRGKVVNELCEWMFPVFARFEELCRYDGIVLAGKHISYLAESMMTWFFMENFHRFQIVHTGRILRI